MDALYRAQSKKKALAEHALIVHEDEATFRQTPTLHQTWAVRNSQPRVPTKGQRNSQKILGAVCPATGQFTYRHQTEYFNADTYISFLDEVLLPAFTNPAIASISFRITLPTIRSPKSILGLPKIENE